MLAVGCLRASQFDAMKDTQLTGQAGICILHEAGGAAFGAKSTPLEGKVDAEFLGAYTACSSSAPADLTAGRKYLLIRGIEPPKVNPDHIF